MSPTDAPASLPATAAEALEEAAKMHSDAAQRHRKFRDLDNASMDEAWAAAFRAFASLVREQEQKK